MTVVNGSERMSKMVPGGTTLRRRAKTIPAVMALLVISTIFLPVLVVAALVADVVTLNRHLRHVRLLAMVYGAALIETLAIFACGAIWIGTGFGIAMETAPVQRIHHRLQWWWTGSLLRTAELTCGMRLDVRGLDAIGGQPLIMLGRHISIADAALPATLLGPAHRYRLRHVLKQDLLWGPALDIVGQRLPNHFVDRRNHTTDDFRAIADLTTGLSEHEGLVIFPEGTFYRPDRWQRRMATIEQRDIARAERLRPLRHLLPPEPGGTIAALEAAPDADVLVIAHVGFEAFESLGDIYRSVPFREPVVVEMSVIPRFELPTKPADLVVWLDETWLELDEWIETAQATKLRR